MEPKQYEEEVSNNSSNGAEYDVPTEGGWIQWFCMLEGNSFFCEIDEDYIRDAFNLYGIKRKLETTRLQECLELILSPTNPLENELQEEEYLEINQEASEVYGVIHSRFILTPRGLALMYQKFMSGHFGVCPRVQCDKQPTLPIGMTDEPRTSRVKMYCAVCKEVYVPKDSVMNIDGAYFGSSFPHVFLQVIL